MHLGLPSPHFNQRNSGSLYFIFRASTQALFKQGAHGLKKKGGGSQAPNQSNPAKARPQAQSMGARPDFVSRL